MAVTLSSDGLITSDGSLISSNHFGSIGSIIAAWGQGQAVYNGDSVSGALVYVWPALFNGTNLQIAYYRPYYNYPALAGTWKKLGQIGGLSSSAQKSELYIRIA